MVKLQEGDAGGVRGLALYMLANEGKDRVAKEQELVLITDPLKILKLSMVGILECFKKFLVKLL